VIFGQFGNSYFDNSNGEVHSAGVDREGFVRGGAEGASEAGRGDAGVEGDQLREDEQSLEAAARH
jgi:hypothetical protein